MGIRLISDDPDFVIEHFVSSAFDQRNQQFALGYEGGDIALYQFNKRYRSFSGTIYSAPIHGTRKPLAMAFDASGQWLAILRPNSVEIQSLRFVLARVWFPFAFLWPPTTVHSLPTTEKGVLAFRPQGDLLAIGTPNGWQLRRSKDLSLAMEQTENPITALAFSDDGCYVAFGEKSGAVQVWRMFQ